MTKKKENTKSDGTLGRLGSGKKGGLGVLGPFLFFLRIVLFQPFPVYRVRQGSPIFLGEVVISIAVGFLDNIRSLILWSKFGGS